MAHLIHHVVSHMAVKRPVARRIGDEFDIARLADADQHRGFGPLRRKRNIFTVGRRDSEMIAVDVHRMMVHGAKVADANLTLSPVLQTNGAVDGNTLPLMVRILKSFIFSVFGRDVPASITHSLRSKAKSRST